MAVTLADIFRLSKLVINLEDKLHAAAAGLKDITEKFEALDRRVYSLEERGRLERELGERARIDQLIDRVAYLEAQLSMLTHQWDSQRPMTIVTASQPTPRLPSE